MWDLISRRSVLAALACAAFAAASPAGATPPWPLPPVPPAEDQQPLWAVLDTFHGAAARADGATYFAQLTPDAVFIGTDASERWTVEELRAYAEPHFRQGKGWLYQPLQRAVVFSPDRKVAWFDEQLFNESYGRTRGSGVLVLTPEGWKIAQYVLSFPVPNGLAKELTGRIREVDRLGP